MSHISNLSATFPPAPKFTNKNLPSLNSKVYIITGGASGVGRELVKMLYLAGGTVYIAARSEARCQEGVDKVLEETKETKETTRCREGGDKVLKETMTKGVLRTMVIDLSDLRTIKPAVEKFLAVESRLDVLFHNAAVMSAPKGSKDKSNHDLEIGTNCLGPLLLTQLLSQTLVNTAMSPDVPTGSVRIVWVITWLQQQPVKGGMDLKSNGEPNYIPGLMSNYMQSKVGVAWIADHFAKQLGPKKVISVMVHPGLMKTELQRNSPAPMRLLMGAVFKGPEYGAYSELFGGFSPEVSMKNNGAFIVAWGRIGVLPDYLIDEMKGGGKAQLFLGWCNGEVAPLR